MKKSIGILVAVCILLTACSAKTVPGTSEASTEVDSDSNASEEETMPPDLPTPTDKDHSDEESKPMPESKANESMGELEDGCRIIIATDLHYLSQNLTDYGLGFNYMVEHGDGNLVSYVEQIVDAFIEEVLTLKPDVLVLSGDLSLNGEILSHEELSGKLEQVKAAGIPVVVIPGNHDINNVSAAAFEESRRYPAAQTSQQDFLRIYGGFGYGSAQSNDPNSLSYVYQVDEYNRLLMLDSCQYEPRGLIGGMIKTETYEWIEKQLELAWEDGVNLIPVAHHNLLDQSEVYVENCTIEHSRELIELLEGWDVPLFLSGHLHVQHFMRSGEQEGIYEVVTGSLAVPPCIYGVLSFMDDGSFEYSSRLVDIEQWAVRHGRTEEDLINFKKFQTSFLKKVFYNQAMEVLKNTKASATQKEKMSQMFAKLNVAYSSGKAVEIKDEIVKNPAYIWWDEYAYNTVLRDQIHYILEDANQDYNHLSNCP